jgi:hypothetical protein
LNIAASVEESAHRPHVASELDSESDADVVSTKRVLSPDRRQT